MVREDGGCEAPSYPICMPGMNGSLEVVRRRRTTHPFGKLRTGSDGGEGLAKRKGTVDFGRRRSARLRTVFLDFTVSIKFPAYPPGQPAPALR